MDNPEKRLSGVIKTNNETIVFSAHNHQFDFYETQYYIPFKQRGTLALESEKDGFLIGHTHNGSKIAIYNGGTKTQVYFTSALNTSTYIIQKGSDEGIPFVFRGVRFTGGILNKLYTPKSLGFEFSKRADTIMSEAGIDNLETQIEFDGYKCNLSVGANLSYSMNMISNKEISLDITFEKDCSLKDYTRIYLAVYNMCCFLTSRKNIRFDDIELLQIDADISEHFVSTAKCYEKDRFDEETSKRSNNCISFNTLGEHVITLFPLMFQRDNSNSSYNSSFIPENDNDVYRMSSIKIRKICSALECELDHIHNREVEKETNFKLLIQQVKAVVVAHRDGEKALSHKTYDAIFGNINNWERPLAERIWSIYKEYETIMQRVFEVYEFRPKETDIENYVKHRNKTTHGTPLPLDKSVVNTGFILVIVTYCCILKRIGFTNDEIREILEMGIFR